MNIGDTVTVRVLNPLWARREAYAYPMVQFESYTGPVLPNPSWVSADQICIGTGNVAHPFRVIEKARIQGYSQASAVSGAQKRTWTVPGSKPGQNYLVTREGAQWGCNCVGFGYRRACTHVVTAKAEYEGGNSLISQQKQKKVKKVKIPLAIKSRLRYPKKVDSETGHRPTFENGERTMAKQYTGTNRSKVVAIMTDYPDTPRDACIQLISELGGMDLKTAKGGYLRAVRLGLAPSAGKAAPAAKAPKAPKVAKDIHAASNKLISSFVAREAKAKAKLEKSVRLINAAHKAKVELNVDEIAKIKEANLARMKEVSAKLQPKGKVRDFTRMAAPEAAGVADFDPTLAREEVNAILRDERLIDVCPKFIRDEL